jgi:hypothetical protein
VQAAAGRALLDWPISFHVAVERVKAAAHLRDGYYGVWKNAGPMMSLRLNSHLDTAVREIVAGEFMRHLPETGTPLKEARHAPSTVMSLQKASRETRVSSKVLRRAVREGSLLGRRLADGVKSSNPFAIFGDRTGNGRTDRPRFLGIGGSPPGYPTAVGDVVGKTRNARTRSRQAFGRNRPPRGPGYALIAGGKTSRCVPMLACPRCDIVAPAVRGATRLARF